MSKRGQKRAGKLKYEGNINKECGDLRPDGAQVSQVQNVKKKNKNKNKNKTIVYVGGCFNKTPREWKKE